MPRLGAVLPPINVRQGAGLSTEHIGNIIQSMKTALLVKQCASFVFKMYLNLVFFLSPLVFFSQKIIL
jgi:hypothetical protein